MEALDVIIIGGGHAGLSTSFYLCRNEISHVVFERGRIGESWRSQRWDSFKLNTPNFINKLPEEYTFTSEPDSFMSAYQFAEYLAEYVRINKLPVNESSRVLSVEKNADKNVFAVTVEHDHHLQHYFAKQVVIASGGQNIFRIPGIGSLLPNDIFQVHAGEYRNSLELPDGAVLVVGSAQSGCQVAEDLAENDREVYLASSKVMRIPRRYRGEDITYWLTTAKFF